MTLTIGAKRVSQNSRRWVAQIHHNGTTLNVSPLGSWFALKRDARSFGDAIAELLTSNKPGLIRWNEDIRVETIRLARVHNARGLEAGRK